MNPNKLLISIYILFAGLSASFAQQIDLSVEKIPLNEVLIEVRDNYELQLSFDDKLLSNYIISLEQKFVTADELLDQLILNTNLKWEKSGDVYLIYREKAKPRTKKESFVLSGSVLDKKSGESLPFSHVIINGYGQVCDADGNFSFRSSGDSIFQLKLSYLGYYILDTVANAGINQIFKLIPSIVALQEIVIEGEVVEKSGQIGVRAGTMQLNHKVASFIPGNGDNSVFNYLRLQPGILAAGEQSGDLIIWGSYEGHSQVLYDGFTIYGLKNYNDNISAVNPYLAKDILIMKGGFDASWGERVGGIVNITGIDGNTESVKTNLTLNNMTLNGMLSIPLFGKSAMIAAFRKTYYNLYNPEDINFISRNRNTTGSEADISLYPDYDFRDMNLKYSGKFNNGDTWFTSYYSGKDFFSYSVEQLLNLYKINQKTDEENIQEGASLEYNKRWNNGGSSKLSFGYSSLIKENNTLVQSTRLLNDRLVFSRDEGLKNELSEYTLKLKNQVIINERNQLDYGIGFYYNNTGLITDSTGIIMVNEDSEANRTNFYLQDKLSISENLKITIGLRLDFPIMINKPYWQPRFAAEYKINNSWNFNFATGLYNQFISESAIVDEMGNYQFVWTISDVENNPVLESSHYVSGFSFNDSHYSFSAESYYKKTNGITRFVNLGDRGRDVFVGEAKAYGLDLYLKRDFRKHSAWISYSLSKTEELFPYFFKQEYRDAPQDQRHEVKMAALFNFSPLRLSFDYVYGSGFMDRTRVLLDQEAERYPYNRLDASISYKFTGIKYFFEAGFSILNLLNTENIKYSNFTRLPLDDTSTISIHAEAVPFTPTLYLNFSF